MSKHILSTKRLTHSQRELLLNSGLSFAEYDAISIEFLKVEIPEKIENAIFTSQNGVRSILGNEMIVERCFCVGEKTTSLLTKNGQNIVKTAYNGAELATYIVKNHKNDVFYYFCGTKRRHELPQILKEAGIQLFELKTYKTELKKKKIDREWDGILFFSPSGVQSYINGQSESAPTTYSFPERTKLFCIGETTAHEARKYSTNVVVANATRTESVIAKAVKTLKTNY